MPSLYDVASRVGHLPQEFVIEAAPLRLVAAAGGGASLPAAALRAQPSMLLAELARVENWHPSLC